MNKLTVITIALLITLCMSACSELTAFNINGHTDTSVDNSAAHETVDQNEETHDGVDNGTEPVPTETEAIEEHEYVLAPESDFTWYGDKLVLERYKGSEKYVEVPAQLDGKDVISTAWDVFSGTGVIGVKLPDTMTVVAAFKGTDTLEEVILGKRTRAISWDAFYGCKALKNVVLNDGLSVIADNAFVGCTSLAHLDLPNTLEGIHNSAFDCCTSLTHLDIPDSVTLIGPFAFRRCGLEEITIPGSVQEFGEHAFWYCNNLNKVVIESGVTKIPRMAFANCKSLEVVEIPESVEYIDASAFKDSKNVVIYGSAGSVAESFAIENGIEFVEK